MHQVLTYADSLSWGIVPGSRARFAFHQRWPGVIEDCLNGRRTVWEDPFKPGRNGLDGLEQRIEVHSPLALVILFLGSNDFQSVHQNTAWHSARGIAALIAGKDSMQEKFAGAGPKSVGLAAEMEAVATEQDCLFFNAATVTESSRVDGVHLDEDQHDTLGRALAVQVSELLGHQPEQ